MSTFALDGISVSHTSTTTCTPASARSEQTTAVALLFCVQSRYEYGLEHRYGSFGGLPGVRVSFTKFMLAARHGHSDRTFTTKLTGGLFNGVGTFQA